MKLSQRSVSPYAKKTNVWNEWENLCEKYAEKNKQ